MAAKNKPTVDHTGRKFIIVREFAAPRALVFQAWTDPKQLAQWWGPKGFTNPVCDWNPQPGKAIHVVMRAPNGADYPMGGEFRAIDAPKRLVFTSGALDETGKMIFEFLHAVTFVERRGKTTVTVRSRVLWTAPAANRYIGGFEAGMTQSLVRLGSLLASLPSEVVLERTFSAPVSRVWQALTDAQAMQQWYFKVREFQPKVGCAFFFDAGPERGKKLRHLCKVTEAIHEKKLAYTWRYEGHAGDTLVTIELSASGRRTQVRLTHTGLETLPRTPLFARENFVGGWTTIIGEHLKKFVETPPVARKPQAVSSKASDTRAREIVISRLVAAPRRLVWEAWTDPAQIVRWWGPRGFTTTIETMDVKPGGTWKHTMHGPDGTDYPNWSVFTEVAKPARIAFTHGGKSKDGPKAEFEGIWTFETQGKQTLVTIRMIFPSKAARDHVVKAYGAIEGGKQTLERLSELLEKT